ncbi:hypothetical protein V5031_24635 [Enterobacter kobei]|uniref:Uncharacterized protein n=3 Tax=Enterobacterales TaxID=91347 RepID=A0ABW8GF44_9GAMM|nr:MULTISPECIES: hypothetical protein [Enterobacterales]MBE8980595.1 hypothetical protein [Escherichia coli]MCU5774411.1 hypothetical protein [Winslowiella arboricola]MCU5778958.1 hypothetical protein [Winslowiella arboricola]MDM2987252.1 hypothetical protein [Citrobacter sp. CK196]MDY4314379.1 hypothetical protein [Pectobacterium actinidiae]
MLILASISEKLLSRKISMWSADRKFNFAEIANFQAPRPPANIRPKRIEQAGGSRINFAAPASEKLSPTTAVYLGGKAPHTVKPGNISRPSGEYCRSGATNPFKAAFPFFGACEKKQAKRAS